MTLVVAWSGADTHGTASAYVASDSRLSWSDGRHYDQGRKVFAFRSSADIIAYCGDVVFPLTALSQVIEMADQGLLFSQMANAKERFEAIKEMIFQRFNDYSDLLPKSNGANVQILHVSRQDNGKGFDGWTYALSKNERLKAQHFSFGAGSSVLHVFGSGTNEFKSNLDRYSKGINANTSRAFFQCFCDTLANTKVDSCGGAPQLVGIYRKPKSKAVSFGIVQKRKRFFLGAQIRKNNQLDQIEWRNENFERVDGVTMRLIPGAQRQPDPLSRR